MQAGPASSLRSSPVESSAPDHDPGMDLSTAVVVWDHKHVFTSLICAVAIEEVHQCRERPATLSLTRRMNVSLEIFDSAGRRVRRLLPGLSRPEEARPDR